MLTRGPGLTLVIFMALTVWAEGTDRVQMRLPFYDEFGNLRKLNDRGIYFFKDIVDDDPETRKQLRNWRNFEITHIAGTWAKVIDYGCSCTGCIIGCGGCLQKLAECAVSIPAEHWDTWLRVSDKADTKRQYIMRLVWAADVKDDSNILSRLLTCFCFRDIEIGTRLDGYLAPYEDWQVNMPTAGLERFNLPEKMQWKECGVRQNLHDLMNVMLEHCKYKWEVSDVPDENFNTRIEKLKALDAKAEQKRLESMIDDEAQDAYQEWEERAYKDFIKEHPKIDANCQAFTLQLYRRLLNEPKLSPEDVRENLTELRLKCCGGSEVANLIRSEIEPKGKTEVSKSEESDVTVT